MKRTIVYTVIGDDDVADTIERSVRDGIGAAYGDTFYPLEGDSYTAATGSRVPATIVNVRIERDPDEMLERAGLIGEAVRRGMRPNATYDLPTLDERTDR